MVIQTYSPWIMLSRNLFRSSIFSRIPGLFVYNGIDTFILRNNFVTDLSKNVQPDEKEIQGKGMLKNSVGKKRGLTNIIEPSLELERRKDIDSVVGLHLGPKSLYWAKVNRRGVILEWKHVDLFRAVDIGRKMQLPKIFAIVDAASESIPFSDVFVLEAPNQGMLSSVTSPAVIASAIFRSQIIAMLLTILNLRLENETSEEYYHKVFLLKPRIVSRFFKLLVGTERVSALPLIDIILSRRNFPSSHSISEVMGESTVDKEDSPNEDVQKIKPSSFYMPIEAPSSILQSYHASEAVNREAMSQALLITMAFYDLIVFQNPKAWARLQK